MSESIEVQCFVKDRPNPFVLEVNPLWAPLGAERFLQLVKDDFFRDIAFFRAVPKFLTQFGVRGHAYEKQKYWDSQGAIKDDPNIGIPVNRGYLSFAGSGPDSRTTQLFIAFEDLPFLGKAPWETPLGRVVRGMETLDAIYKGYGDIPPFGKGPDQIKIRNQGNQYLNDNFPFIDYLEKCTVLGETNQAMSSENKSENEDTQMGKLPLFEQKPEQHPPLQDIDQIDASNKQLHHSSSNRLGSEGKDDSKQSYSQHHHAVDVKFSVRLSDSFDSHVATIVFTAVVFIMVISLCLLLRRVNITKRKKKRSM